MTEATMSNHVAGQDAAGTSQEFDAMSLQHPRAWTTAILFLIPCCLYFSQINRWSLDRDELYTLKDSLVPVGEIVRYTKPLNYLLTHFSLKLPLPLEAALRLPSALAASFVAPAFYLLLSWPGCRQRGLLSAIFVAANPWLFELSQCGRHYSLMFLLTTVAVLSLYRFACRDNWKWCLVYVISGCLATLTHTTAILMFPAGLVALVAMRTMESPTALWVSARKWIGPLAVMTVVGVLSGTFWFRRLYDQWTTSTIGQFGDYSFAEMARAVLVFGGVQVWAIALLPCVKSVRNWAPEEVFLILVIVGCLAPILLLAPFGGGVHVRYAVQALPCLFVLAGYHLDVMFAHLPASVFRLTLLAAILATYLPHGLSTLVDGDHYDYREAARFLEQLPHANPIIASTSHNMLEHYLTRDTAVEELGFLTDVQSDESRKNGLAGMVLDALMEQADQQERSLLVVSREDRSIFSIQASCWMGRRFAVLRTIEKPRFDHRRNRLVIYEYRPSLVRDQ